MITTKKIRRAFGMIGLASEIVYLQKPYWCNMSARALKLSFMAPREYYDYDIRPQKPLPLIVFLCGGAWQKMDRNAHMPNWAYFVDRGFAVASVEYSTLPYTEYPEALMEVKTAIRFLRANAEKFHIDPQRVAIMGGSAGAYLANLTALTGNAPEFRNEYYADQDDSVQAVVSLYTPAFPGEEAQKILRVRVDNFPDLCAVAQEQQGPLPPFLLLHGTADNQVSHTESIRFYESLSAKGCPCDLYLLDGANHADAAFVQPEIKQIMADFLEKNLLR